MTGVCIFSIIICEFSHWQEFCPVIILKANKYLKISFDDAILVFYLIVSLGLEHGEELLLNI